MARKAEPMARNLINIRALVDSKTRAVLERWAERDGRSAQMHAGIVLRRVAALMDSEPQRLVELGIIAPIDAAQLAS